MRFSKSLQTGSGGGMHLRAAALLSVSLACLTSGALAQEAMSVDASGNVGIGTSLPEAHVHVQGTGGQVFLIESTSPSVADISLKNTGNIWGFRVTTVGNFSIVDRTTATLVMTIQKQAPANSVYVASTGNVGIGGLSVPSRRLHVLDTSADGPVLRIQDSTEYCDVDPEPSSPVWSCPSDLRLKTNVHPADTASILRSLEGIQLFEYQLKSNGETYVGPVAQYLEESHPERVTQSDDGLLMVKSATNTELLGAIQELQKMIVELRGQVETLRSELEAERAH